MGATEHSDGEGYAFVEEWIGCAAWVEAARIRQWVPLNARLQRSRLGR